MRALLLLVLLGGGCDDLAARPRMAVCGEGDRRLRPCGACGSETVVCEDGDFPVAGVCVDPCDADAAPPPDARPRPDATPSVDAVPSVDADPTECNRFGYQTQPCGACGWQERSCAPGGHWGEWSACYRDEGC